MDNFYVVMNTNGTLNDMVFAKYNFDRAVFYDYQFKGWYSFTSVDDNFQDMDIGMLVQKKDNHYKIAKKDIDLEVVNAAMRLIAKYRHLKLNFDPNIQYDTAKLITEAFMERDYIDPYILGIVNLFAKAIDLKVRKPGEVKRVPGAWVSFPEQVMEIAIALYEIFSEFIEELSTEPFKFLLYDNGKNSVSYKNIISQVEFLSGCPLSLYTNDFAFRSNPAFSFSSSKVIYYHDINIPSAPEETITPELCAEIYRNLTL